MAVIDDIADELALKALKLEEASGDETLIKKIGEALASSSPTMEERFLTSVRIRRGQKRAMAMLEDFEAGMTHRPPPAEETTQPLALPPSDDDLSIDVDEG